MRTWRYFAEEHLLAADKHLHAKNSVTAQGVGNLFGDILRLLQGFLAHGLCLPGLTIVAVHLVMAYGIQESGAATVADGKQGNLIVKLNKALHNHFSGTGAATLLGDIPGPVGIGRRLADALSMSGRTHDGLHHAGGADLFY